MNIEKKSVSDEKGWTVAKKAAVAAIFGLSSVLAACSSGDVAAPEDDGETIPDTYDDVHPSDSESPQSSSTATSGTILIQF